MKEGVQYVVQVRSSRVATFSNLSKLQYLGQWEFFVNKHSSLDLTSTQKKGKRIPVQHMATRQLITPFLIPYSL